MMTRSRWFRWAAGIVLGGVALLGGGLAVLFSIDPGATIILFTMLVFPLFGKARPSFVVLSRHQGAARGAPETPGNN